MNRFCFAVILAVILPNLAPQRAHADRILYHVDNVFTGTDRMAEALAGLSGTHSVTIAASIEDFTAAIALGDYELGIIQTGNTGGGQDQAYAALKAHVDRGGAAIINATYPTLLAGFLDPFGVSGTATVNDLEVIVTDPLLAAGITAPIELEAFGFVSSVGLAGPYSAATYRNVFGDLSAPAIIGVAPRTFVNGFLSFAFVDGAQGVQLYTNQINTVLADAVIPEPASVVLFGLGGLGLAGHCWLRRRRAGVGGRV